MKTQESDERRAQTEVQRLRRALEFYADQNNWKYQDDGTGWWWLPSEGPERAKRALT